VALLALFWAGSKIAHWTVADIADWTSLPVLLLIVAVISVIAEPVVNSYSRWQEHQADVFGLAITYGIVPDSVAEAARSFQVMGEIGLDEPNPNRFIVFWLYSHPPIADRMAFAEAYLPSPGNRVVHPESHQ
jgi:Zn-dependent protease with chaperone function